MATLGIDPKTIHKYPQVSIVSPTDVWSPIILPHSRIETPRQYMSFITGLPAGCQPGQGHRFDHKIYTHVLVYVTVLNISISTKIMICII